MANASTKLRVEMARRNQSMADLGRLTKIRYWRLYKIINAVSEPTLAEAVKIEAAGLGIRVESWPSLRGPMRKLGKLRSEGGAP